MISLMCYQIIEKTSMVNIDYDKCMPKSGEIGSMRRQLESLH